MHIKIQSVPHTSMPMKDEPLAALKMSASDINMERRHSQTNSVNSYAAFNDPDNSAESFNDKLYNVTGKVLGVQGLKFHDGCIYCKVRIISPHKHRLRKIFGDRVIAKSPLVKASQPTFNMPFDVDRGMGITGNTMIRIDIKREGKEHLASREFNIKNLFSGPGGEGDKIQQVLTLEHNIQVEVFLQHTSQDGSTFLHRRPIRSVSNISRSFLK